MASNQKPNQIAVRPKREMPHDLNAEIGVLGSILLRPNIFKDYAEHIQPDDFYFQPHKLIFRAMKWLNDFGMVIDSVTIKGYLEQNQNLNAAGGENYIYELTDAVPTSHNISSYISILKTLSTARAAIDDCYTFIADTYASPLLVGDRIIDLDKTIQDKMLRVANSAKRPKWLDDPSSGLIESTKESVFRLFNSSKNKKSITGFPEMDNLLGDLDPGTLMILGARPSMGKSALALSILCAMAEMDPESAYAYFSLEVTNERLVSRALLYRANITRGEIVHCNYYNNERIDTAGEYLSRLPICFYDDFDPTIDDIRMKLLEMRKTQPKKKLRVAVIDYVQLVKPPKHITNREQAVAYISRCCKKIAKEFGICVIAIAQLNRDIEKRPIEARRPLLSDLRESGALEQDGDKILGLWRKEHYYENEGNCDEEWKGMAEVTLLKNRDGRLGSFKLKFNKQFAWFESLLNAKETEPQRSMFDDDDPPY